ncbi:MAG: hypothetical protein AAF558_06275 [Verrucomicrobiota bacterium]
MNLIDHIRFNGTLYSCSLFEGSSEKASNLSVYIEGPIENEIARKGMWRGFIEDVLPLTDDTFHLHLDDGRVGKVKIQDSHNNKTLFLGLGLLEKPIPLEEEEEEILRILEEIRTNQDRTLQ